MSGHYTGDMSLGRSHLDGLALSVLGQQPPAGGRCRRQVQEEGGARRHEAGARRQEEGGRRQETGEGGMSKEARQARTEATWETPAEASVVREQEGRWPR